MASEKYKAYLQSPEWTLRRTVIFRRAHSICERCLWRRGDHVHHLTYARIYNEQPEDLVLLCKACHEFEHSLSDKDPCEANPKRIWRSPHFVATAERLFPTPGDGLKFLVAQCNMTKLLELDPDAFCRALEILDPDTYEQEEPFRTDASDYSMP